MTPLHEAHVFLVRHGRTALNAAGQLRGHLDPPLDDLGRVEAYALARTIAYCRPIRILASPLQRAIETAEPLAGRSRLAIEIDGRLIDRDYGRWAGRTIAQVAEECGSIDDAPGVEPRDAVLSRMRAVLDEQVALVGRGPVVLITHDALNRALLADLAPRLGDPDSIEQATGCWNVLMRAGRGWNVEQVNQRL